MQEGRCSGTQFWSREPPQMRADVQLEQCKSVTWMPVPAQLLKQLLQQQGARPGRDIHAQAEKSRPP